MNKRCIEKNKKRDNSGFTLVELMVVIVLIAILAAIAVPAFLSYLDKQKREQVIINAKDCLMSAQSLSTDQYVYGRPVYSSLDTLNSDVGKTTKLVLTGENKEGSITYVKYGSKGKDLYTIHEFRYTENGITAIWKMEDAKWIYDDEVDVEKLTGIVSGGGSGSSGIVNNDIIIPVADKTPADNPGTNNPPAENPPAEDPPAEDPPAEDPPVVNPPSEDPPAEDPPAEDPPAEDPPAEDPPVTLANVAGGELVINVEGKDILTGKMIKDSDFWPSAEYLQMENSIRAANGDWGFWNEYIEVKEGDLILDNDVLYVMTKDAKIERGNAANGVASASFSTALDYKNVITIKDFEYHYGTYVIKRNIKGTLYYDEEENALFVALESNWYNEPSLENHSCWIVLKNMNQE